MKNTLSSLSTAALAVLLCACAATTVRQTWKSPDFNGRTVQKLAVLAVADGSMVRPGLENRLVRQIGKQGQAAFPTFELLSLLQIKENKESAAARFRQEGADAILIVRLVDQTSYDRESRNTPSVFVPITTGYGSYGWYDYYSVAFMDMGSTYSSTRDYLLLDTSLFDLNTSKRLWSIVTRTVLKDTSDRLVEADALVAKVVAQLRKDGIVR